MNLSLVFLSLSRKYMVFVHVWFFFEIQIPRLAFYTTHTHTHTGISRLGQKNTDIEKKKEKQIEEKEYVSSCTGDNIEEKLHRL